MRMFLIYIPLCFYLYWGNIFSQTHNFIFTFHYVSTYTKRGSRPVLYQEDLHSTMLLLIPAPPPVFSSESQNLHSTMLLLIPEPLLKPSVIICIYIPLCLYLYQKNADE